MSAHERHDDVARGEVPAVGDPPPTPDEAAATRYVDGELPAAERAAFERRLASEPLLRREVAAQQALTVLARRHAPPEPADHEWADLALDPVQRTTNRIGWALFVAGALGLAGLGVWSVATDASSSAWQRALTIALIVGPLVLLLAALRARLRTIHLDPYRKVQR